MSRIERLEELLADDPNDPELPYMIAQEYANQGDHATAVTWYDRCLGLAADHAYAYYHKARAHEALGAVDRARSTLEAGLAAADRSRDGRARGEIEEYLAELD
ncbi:MAG: tetratricopeptide repeat protein [Planctomycetes bacterium]|nr:tetratricopeptide repeat protein [Planctomycetota bacterium]